MKKKTTMKIQSIGTVSALQSVQTQLQIEWTQTQFRPRADCSFRSNLLWVDTVFAIPSPSFGHITALQNRTVHSFGQLR